MNDQSISSVPLMAHLVAGYPDMEASLSAAEGLIEGGAAYLEIQIPFSDPSADGPTIRDACATALAQGFSVHDSFLLIRELRRLYPSVPLFVMAYASLVVTPGVGPFVDTLGHGGRSGAHWFPIFPLTLTRGWRWLGASLGPLGPTVVTPGRCLPGPLRRDRAFCDGPARPPVCIRRVADGYNRRFHRCGSNGGGFLDLCARGGSRVLGALEFVRDPRPDW